jgi:hypothetical protein
MQGPTVIRTGSFECETGSGVYTGLQCGSYIYADYAALAARSYTHLPPTRGAASCRETGVFGDTHGLYAKSGNPRCIGGGG